MRLKLGKYLGPFHSVSVILCIYAFVFWGGIEGRRHGHTAIHWSEMVSATSIIPGRQNVMKQISWKAKSNKKKWARRAHKGTPSNTCHHAEHTCVRPAFRDYLWGPLSAVYVTSTTYHRFPSARCERNASQVEFFVSPERSRHPYLLSLPPAAPM